MGQGGHEHEVRLRVADHTWQWRQSPQTALWSLPDNHGRLEGNWVSEGNGPGEDGGVCAFCVPFPWAPLLI